MASQRGFTLLELGLAIGIGIIVTAAMVAGYNQVRNNAGDAAMKLRIGNLQATVETLYSAQGTLPSLSSVRQKWMLAHPDDWGKSPWGGNIDAPEGSAAIMGGAFASGSHNVKRFEESGLTTGGLYYYYVGDGTATASAVARGALWDNSLQQEVTITGYGVAGLKTRTRHFMVTSGR
ncbi:type II secretion system protein [bacterium]|nr:type II secretion system protein [bacterium]